MFREMRRNKQLLSVEETIEILNSCTAGVLGVSGDDGYPYTVPISYAYQDGRLFFHSARTGHKIDGIQANDKVTFCAIAKDEVIPETLTTHFRSVSIFGRARILTGDDERRAAMECLAEKYSPGRLEQARREIEHDWNRFCVVEVKIEHMTGKAAIELVNKKG